MKIAIMSDSHDNWINLEKAVRIANEEKCRALLHAGDLVAPTAVAYLKDFKGNVHIVYGNNELERVQISKLCDDFDNVTLERDFYEGEIDNVKIFMTHFPRYAELAAAAGKFGLVIHGHTHKFRNETVGETILLNPGEVHGGWHNEPSFVILDTKSNTIKRVHLDSE